MYFIVREPLVAWYVETHPMIQGYLCCARSFTPAIICQIQSNKTQYFLVCQIIGGKNSVIICSYLSLLTYPNLAVLKDVSYKTRSVSYNYQQSFRTKKDVSYNLYETSWSHSYKKKVGTKRLFLYETDWYETSLVRNVQVSFKGSFCLFPDI